MTLHEIWAYINHSCNALFNKIYISILTDIYGEIITINQPPSRNPLNLTIEAIVSRQFTKDGTIEIKLTLIYRWYLGQGYWECDLTDAPVDQDRTIKDIVTFFQTRFRPFQSLLAANMYRNYIYKGRRALPTMEMEQAIREFNYRNGL